MEADLKSSMQARKELEEKLSLLQAAAAKQADEMETLRRVREQREREFEKQLLEDRQRVVGIAESYHLEYMRERERLVQALERNWSVMGGLAGTSFAGLAVSAAPPSTIPPALEFDFTSLGGGVPQGNRRRDETGAGRGEGINASKTSASSP